MIPITITSGFLIAIGTVVVFQQPGTNPEHIVWQFPNTQWGDFIEKLYQVGVLGFQVMIPVFSTGIAYAISGTQAIGPALLRGYIINEPILLDTEIGARFVGGILIGFLTGYWVLAFQRIPWPSWSKATVDLMIIPLGVTLIIFIISYYLLGKPLALGMDILYDVINSSYFRGSNWG